MNIGNILLATLIILWIAISVVCILTIINPSFYFTCKDSLPKCNDFYSFLDKEIW